MPYLTFSLTEGPLKARPRKGLPGAPRMHREHHGELTADFLVGPPFGRTSCFPLRSRRNGVDVGDLQMLSFLQSQAAGVDGAGEGAVVWGANVAEECWKRLLVVEFAKQAQCTDIGLLGTLAKTVELKGIYRFFGTVRSS